MKGNKEGHRIFLLETEEISVKIIWLFFNKGSIWRWPIPALDGSKKAVFQTALFTFEKPILKKRVK